MANTTFDPCIIPMLASKLSKLFNLPIFCFLLGGPVQSNLGSTGRDRRAHKRKWSGTHVAFAFMVQSGELVEGGIHTSKWCINGKPSTVKRDYQVE